MIVDGNQFLIFIPAALALNLTPGSDMLFCLGQGLKSGPKAGVAASFGVATGSFLHSLMAAFGLAALLATHPLAFEIIRWAGVAYLLWLAVQTFRNPIGKLQASDVSSSGIIRAWRDGVFVNLLNPKVAIFILALIPQFVDPSKGSTVLQFLIFGAILNIGGTTINALVGVFSGSIGRMLATNDRVAKVFQWLTSIVFVGLAARLAFDRGEFWGDDI